MRNGTYPLMFRGRVYNSRDMEMNIIKDYKIPKHVTYQNTLEILMKNMKKMDTITPNQTSKYDFYIKIGNVIFIISARIK